MHIFRKLWSLKSFQLLRPQTSPHSPACEVSCGRLGLTAPLPAGGARWPRTISSCGLPGSHSLFSGKTHERVTGGRQQRGLDRGLSTGVHPRLRHGPRLFATWRMRHRSVSHTPSRCPRDERTREPVGDARRELEVVPREAAPRHSAGLLGGAAPTDAGTHGRPAQTAATPGKLAGSDSAAHACSCASFAPWVPFLLEITCLQHWFRDRQLFSQDVPPRGSLSRHLVPFSITDGGTLGWQRWTGPPTSMPPRDSKRGEGIGEKSTCHKQESPGSPGGKEQSRASPEARGQPPAGGHSVTFTSTARSHIGDSSGQAQYFQD